MNEIADLVKDNVFNYNDLDELIFKITATAYSKIYNRNFIKTINAKFSEGLIFEDNQILENLKVEQPLHHNYNHHLK